MKKLLLSIGLAALVSFSSRADHSRAIFQASSDQLIQVTIDGYLVNPKPLREVSIDLSYAGYKDVSIRVIDYYGNRISYSQAVFFKPNAVSYFKVYDSPYGDYIRRIALYPYHYRHFPRYGYYSWTGYKFHFHPRVYLGVHYNHYPKRHYGYYKGHRNHRGHGYHRGHGHQGWKHGHGKKYGHKKHHKKGKFHNYGQYQDDHGYRKDRTVKREPRDRRDRGFAYDSRRIKRRNP